MLTGGTFILLASLLEVISLNSFISSYLNYILEVLSFSATFASLIKLACPSVIYLLISFYSSCIVLWLVWAPIVYSVAALKYAFYYMLLFFSSFCSITGTSDPNELFLWNLDDSRFLFPWLPLMLLIYELMFFGISIDWSLYVTTTEAVPSTVFDVGLWR